MIETKELMKKIILAEDQPIVRNGLRLLIESNNNYQVIAEAENGKQVLELISKGTDADLIISDLAMPEMGGLELLQNVTKLQDAPQVLILSMSEKDEDLADALFTGASGYISKAVDAAELFFAMEKIFSGGRYFCSGLTIKILERMLPAQSFRDDSGIQFTRREIDILKLMGNGFTNSEIAEALFLSKRTVEGHRQSMIERTGGKNTATLIKFASTKNII